MAKPVKGQYELRPSNAHRWMVCHGQPEAVKSLPDKSNKYAERGTVAHALLELALRLDLDDSQVESYEGKYLPNTPKHKVDDEMIRGVGHATDYVRSYMARNKKADFHAEVAIDIDLQKYKTDGHADVIIDNLPAELVVLDYKNGVNVVDVAENEQLLMYAVGYMQKHRKRILSKTVVTLVIVQPNANDGEPPVREIEVHDEEIQVFFNMACAAAIEVHKPNPTRVAGDHCRFCRAYGSCRTAADYALEQAKLVFGQYTEDDMPKPQDLSPIDIAEIIQGSTLVRAWLEAVDLYAIDIMLEGTRVPGYKVVGSRPHRRWEDEAAVVKLVQKLGAPQLAPPTPLSPSKMEKLTRGKAASVKPIIFQKLNKYITRNMVEPRVAPEADNRPHYVKGQEFLDE